MSAPYWPHRTPENRRRAYPKYKGDGTADVVIIGGGLTGCASAYTLAAAGLKVVLLEASRLAVGETGAGLGMIVPEPDAVFRSVEAARGRKVARLAWEEAQRAAIDFTATLKKLDINCDLKPTATHVATSARSSASVVEPVVAPSASVITGISRDRKSVV